MSNQQKAIFKLALLVIVAVSASFADVPPQINYQGRLNDNGGNPVDTIVDMTFVIYDDSTGGNSKWSETHDSVIVLDGLFNVVLGSISGGEISDTVFSGSDRFLGIQVGTDPELSPRMRIVAVGYAMRAKQADTAQFAISGPAAGGGWTDDGTEIRLTTQTDNVVIGETTPLTAGTKLEVRGYAGEDMALSRIYFNNSNPFQMHYPAFELYNAAYDYIPLKINGAGIILQSINNKGARATEIVNQISPDTSYFNGGPFGIGTNYPTGQLHVSGSDIQPLVKMEQHGTGQGLKVNSSGGDGLWVEQAGNHAILVTNAEADGILIEHANNDGVRVEDAGGHAGWFGGNGYFRDNLGIGTEAPSEKLEVDGTIYSSSGGFRFPDGTIQVSASEAGVSVDGSVQLNHLPKFTSSSSLGNSSLSESSDGKIGIGHETPHSDLQIEGSIAKSVIIIVGDYTITENDCIVIGNGMTNMNVHLPSAVGISGRIYTIKNRRGGYTIDVHPFAGETLDDNALPYTLAGYQFITIVSDGANWWIIG